MVKKLTNNFGWKILSLVLAFILWLTVVNIEDPQVSTTIRGIPVEKLNESAITSQKQAIQYVSGDTVDVKVKGKRSLVYKLTEKNIRAYVDMKNLSITGAVDIQLNLPNEVELISKTPTSVSVELEKIIKKTFSIQYEKYGKAKQGYVDLSPSIQPGVIELEAAESIIYKIEKVVVPVDITGISDEINISVKPQIYDYAGNLVAGVNASIAQANVKIPVEKTKTLPINFVPEGNVAAEYAYLGHSLSESTVIVRGPEKIIDKMEEIAVKDISISGLTKTEVLTVNLAKQLPDGVSLNQDKSTVELTIEVEPYITKDFELEPTEIKMEAVPEGKKVLVITEEPFKVVYKGIESKIKGLDKQDIKPYLDLGNKTNGQYTLQIQWGELQDMERVSPPNYITILVVDEEILPENREPVQ